MDAKVFFNLVDLMRLYQKEYFKTRDKEVLIKSKHYEKLVDHEIDSVKNILNNKKFLYVDAGVRYWEDSEINGIRDNDLYDSRGATAPAMPCAERVKPEPTTNIFSDHYRWKPIIDVETGIIINWKKGVTASVHYKVCDDCMITYKKGDEVLCNNDDELYVPQFLSPKEEGYGDYIIMDIDENGQISNWKPNEVEEWYNDQLKHEE